MTAKLRKYLVPEFIIGDGAIQLVSQYLSFYNPKKVLLVTDPGLRKVGLISKIEKLLTNEAISYVIFDEVSPNPRDREVMRGSEFYAEEKCDVILAVGGGSPLDAAKGIAIVSTNHKGIVHFEGVDNIPYPIPPLLCIPTTAGTSADISQFAIILNSKELNKFAIISKTIVPDTALIDPETTLTMDVQLTAETGLDALVHAVEAYVSNASSSVTDLNAIEAIRLINTFLPLTLKSPNNMEYRNKMMLASLLAGMAFSNASLGLVHAMAHSLGGLKDSAHGLCNAILLDHVVDFNYDACPDRFIAIGQELGLDLNTTKESKAKLLLVERIKEFKYNCGIRKNLSAIGIAKSDVPRLAEKAIADPCVVTNPKSCTAAEIEKIFLNAI